MLKFIANWILQALALVIVSKIFPQIQVVNFIAALVAVAVIGLVNLLVKPLLLLLTLPITILTFGLFTFVINALMLILASAVTPGFHIQGFGAAIIGSILLSLISTVLHALVR